MNLDALVAVVHARREELQRVAALLEGAANLDPSSSEFAELMSTAATARLETATALLATVPTIDYLVVTDAWSATAVDCVLANENDLDDDTEVPDEVWDALSQRISQLPYLETAVARINNDLIDIAREALVDAGVIND